MSAAEKEASPGRWRRTRRAVLPIATTAVGIVFVFHFGMTALYNAPFNPVKEKVGGSVDNYMAPYFAQDWHLFAPNPISSDQGMLVRAMVREADGTQTITQWLDVTTAGYRSLYEQRLWPSRVPRMPSGAVRQLDGWRDPTLENIRNKTNDDNPLPLTPVELATRTKARHFVASIATIEATRRWGPGVEAVQARIVTNEFPRFSDRANPDDTGKVTYRDLDWMPAERP